MQKLYLTHLNLEYDKNELKDEVGELDFKPFAPEQYYFRNTWLKARLREHIFMYPHIENLHKQLVNLRNLITNQEHLGKYFKQLINLEREITLFHSKIVKDISLKYKDSIDLVGFHGQTIFHDSEKKKI